MADHGKPRERSDLAREVMLRFAERTGIASPAGTQRRYLWTDAFAVCNFLALHRATGAREHERAARSLVDCVHEGLGRHRADDARTGWISGLPEDEGRAHPTRGGLRIGKRLPERRPGEPFDERLEWDRDGQYFHYLTRWMHALARMAQATQEARYLDQAVELALAAHAAFACTGPGGRRLLYWKMSIDLRRPLVPSMGHHDPLDGLLTCMELRAGLAALGRDATTLDLAFADYRSIGAASDWTTDDPLGIGGLLAGAFALAQLIARGQADDTVLLERLLHCAAVGLESFCWRSPLGLPAQHRLAFRELGLAIGLHGVPEIAALWERDRARLGGAAVAQRLGELREHVPLATGIEDCWLDPGNRAVATWTSHRDINEVMLATSLLPDGYLTV